MPGVVPTRRNEALAAFIRTGDAGCVTLLTILAVWLVLSLVVGLAVVALCRGGCAEDDHWAFIDSAPTRRRPRRRTRTPV